MKPMEKKQTVRGVEQGVAGFGLRVVVPMEYQGQHIGTVEFGFDFGEAFINVLKENLESEVYLYAFENGETKFLAGTGEEISPSDEAVSFAKEGRAFSENVN